MKSYKKLSPLSVKPDPGFSADFPLAATRCQQGVLLSGLLLILLVLVQLPLATIAKITATVLLVAYGIFMCRTWQQRGGDTLSVEGEQWWFRRREGVPQKAELSVVFTSPWLVVVSWKTADSRHSAALWFDGVDKVAWHRLHRQAVQSQG